MFIDTQLETKSADPLAAPSSPPRARRYRPKRTTADRVREAVLMLAEGRAELLSHQESAWSSITFSGTRHEIMLDFNGDEAVEVGENFVAELPEHEFRIPGQLVAEATVRSVDHTFSDTQRMVVTAVLLLLEDV